jgi:hypothetical protein
MLSSEYDAMFAKVGRAVDEYFATSARSTAF